MGKEGLLVAISQVEQRKVCRQPNMHSSTLLVHSCMSLDLPCCGEARLQQHGAGQWEWCSCAVQLLTVIVFAHVL